MFLFFLLLPGVILSVFGCSDIEKGIRLTGKWEWQKGFQRTWLTHPEAGKWHSTENLKFSVLRGNSQADLVQRTLRYRLAGEVLQRFQRNEEQALFIEELIGEHIDIYFNSVLFASMGEVDSFKPVWWRSLLKVIPARAFKPGRENYLTIVFTNSGRQNRIKNDLLRRNEIVGIPVIGDAEKLFNRYTVNTSIAFAIAAVYLILGIFHLAIGIMRRNEIHNLIFGVFSMGFVLFLIANMEGKEIIWRENVILQFTADRISLKVMTAGFVLFFPARILGRVPVFSLVVAGYCGILALLDLLIVFNVWTFSFLHFWYPAILAAVFYTSYLLISEMLKKNRVAYVLFIGVVGILVSTFHDILLTERVIEGTLISPYLLLFFFGGVSVLLIENFVRAHNRADDLNDNLEKLVDQKTNELLSAKEKITSLTRKKMFLQAYDLTYREQEIINLILNGMSTGELAEFLEISARTVEKHVQNIFQKLQVHSRMGIVALYNNFSILK